MCLKEENAALSEIASRLGCESEAASSRAFKRFVGISPGAARRREPRALHNAAVLPQGENVRFDRSPHAQVPDIAS